MLLRSTSTPFLHAFLSTSSPSPSSSLHLRRAFSDSHLPSLGDDSKTPTGLRTELSFSVYNTFNQAPPAKMEPHQEQEMEEEDQEQAAATAQPELPELPLFLARGMGIDRLASGLFTAGMGMGSEARMASGVDEQAVMALDAQYKEMVDEQPGNALFLRNYAQFLYEVKCDARRGEEYYSRAMLADPSDGEIMSQYAKLVWEVHRDHDRSLVYFQKSVQAAPRNSHVLAAYASFLWEQDDEDDDDDGLRGGEHAAQPRQLASAAAV